MRENAIIPTCGETMYIFAEASPGQLHSWQYNESIHEGQLPEILSVQFVHRQLDIVALEQALSCLIRRHESLRTYFCIRDAQLMQVIVPYDAALFPIIHVNRDNADHVYNHCIQEICDLTAGPPVRILLYPDQGGPCKFLFLLHHIIADAWSTGIIKDELNAYYAAFKAGRMPVITPLVMQLREYSSRQIKRFKSRKEGDYSFWISKLGEKAQEDPEVFFQIINTAPAAAYTEMIPAARYTVFNDMHLPSVLYTCMALAVHMATGKKDLLIAMPVADRSAAAHRQIIGSLVGGIYVCSNLQTDITFSSQVSRLYLDIIRSCRHTIFNHALLGLNEPSLRAGTDIFLNYEGKGTDTLPGNEVVTGHQEEGGTYYKLSCTITGFENGLSLRWKYSHAFFDQQQIEHISQLSNQLLNYAFNHPMALIGEMLTK